MKDATGIGSFILVKRQEEGEGEEPVYDFRDILVRFLKKGRVDEF